MAGLTLGREEDLRYGRLGTTLKDHARRRGGLAAALLRGDELGGAQPKLAAPPSLFVGVGRTRIRRRRKGDRAGHGGLRGLQRRRRFECARRGHGVEVEFCSWIASCRSGLKIYRLSLVFALILLDGFPSGYGATGNEPMSLRELKSSDCFCFSTQHTAAHGRLVKINRRQQQAPQHPTLL